MLPFATPELAGVPAGIKVAPEDFRVDEIPAYLPSGEGPHLYVRIEKRCRDTAEVAKELARHFGLPQREVGYAGQKDRQAVTTQWMSLPGVAAEDALQWQGEGVRVLEAVPHRNKLRTGHLRGNRFRILLRGVDEEGFLQLRRILDAIAERGLPNYFGAQRFGRDGDNAELGRTILLGEREDPRLRRALRDGRLRRFLVSAFQSEIFNRVLAKRLEDGSWDTPLLGDVLQRLPAGRPFLCSDPEADAPRVASFECSITGPLPGGRMHPVPEGEAARLEAEVLAASGVSEEALLRSRDAPGGRRPLRLFVRPQASLVEEGAWLDFELPPGAYATVLLREITKS